MTVVAMVLLAAGALFLLTAAIGVIRLRDPLQQMHSATKAGTLGTALLILGCLLSGVGDGTASGLLAILFLLITLPLGAQVLGRASYISGTRLEGLREDPLAEELERADNPIH
ncbi:monovalent cation/H(+) antiporter subunit G [Sphingomonas sp. CJ20]